MAYNLTLAARIREKLAALAAERPELEDTVEKEMMGGAVFMVDGKMCIGIIKDEMMCRIDPALWETALEKPGCREMDFTKRPMKGYVLISDEGMRSDADFNYWIGLCLEFNKRAKASKKKK